MLVVMFAVKSVAVTIVDVINVIFVGYGFMAAAFAVHVFFNGVFCYRFVFIVVIAVKSVVVGAVHVVNVIAVLDGFVAAAFAVHVFFNGVFCM
ncbi:hypothetical protein [Arcanobacterium haemolyticum]|uniref:hypothetical protein n=1 Tax=Arcanobacterium haemolyticum TaxID=28264 RepID=UPI001CC20CF6|nr:hypothetical protein [Arcanobacterium haemolyticum]